MAPNADLDQRQEEDPIVEIILRSLRPDDDVPIRPFSGPARLSDPLVDFRRRMDPSVDLDVAYVKQVLARM